MLIGKLSVRFGSFSFKNNNLSMDGNPNGTNKVTPKSIFTKICKNRNVCVLGP